MGNRPILIDWLKAGQVNFTVGHIGYRKGKHRVESNLSRPQRTDGVSVGEELWKGFRGKQSSLTRDWEVRKPGMCRTR